MIVTVDPDTRAVVCRNCSRAAEDAVGAAADVVLEKADAAGRVVTLTPTWLGAVVSQAVIAVDAAIDDLEQVKRELLAAEIRA